MSTRTRKTTTDAVEILHARYVKGRPDMEAMMDEVEIEGEVALKLHALRNQAGLTQQQLAEKVGTTQPVISRLENADYEGHSLAMLNRIARALGHRVQISFIPRENCAESWCR